MKVKSWKSQLGHLHIVHVYKLIFVLGEIKISENDEFFLRKIEISFSYFTKLCNSANV